MVGIASAATAVTVGYVAGGTSSIRVGAGGIMLPNHSPLVIAEQFGTLATLYPGRIDLGLGRAPGSDGYTQRALRRSPDAADTFPEDVAELQAFSGRCSRASACRRCPAAGPRCRCGSSAPRCTAPRSRRISACPTPSPPTSHRTR